MSRFRVSESMSTRPTSAPTYLAQFALAMNVRGDVTTRSPGPSPATDVHACKPAVPLENATAWRAPTRSAIARSKASMVGPWVSQSPPSTSVTASMSLWSTDCRPYGIFCIVTGSRGAYEARPLRATYRWCPSDKQSPRPKPCPFETQPLPNNPAQG